MTGNVGNSFLKIQHSWESLILSICSIHKW